MRIPGCGFHLMCHPDTTSQSERGFRDVLSAWAAIGKARPGLRCQGVFFTPAPCIEFDSPRVGGSVDGLRPGQDARSASHLYLAGALRGESAYLLRKSAPASAACRRPRPLATNASRLLNARALHRVRFSAVWGLRWCGAWQPELNRHLIYIWLKLCAENPRVRFANPHRLRPPAGALARSLQTLRVCLTLAPCIEFDSPRCGLEIKGR